MSPIPRWSRAWPRLDSDNIDDILIKDANLPNTFLAFLPLLLPVALISLSSFAAMYADPDGVVYPICTTIGHKVVALFIGVLYSLWLGYKQRKAVHGSTIRTTSPRKPIPLSATSCSNKWVARGLIVCLSPLLITAMGGAFGTVLKSAPALEPLSEMVGNSPVPAILVPWAVAVIMMSAVGSMTTAGMTAAGIVLPMLRCPGSCPLWPLFWPSAPAL